MEELRSTEVLDREILEDARKKAYRILKAADDTVKAQAEVWQRKADAAITDIRHKYADRTAKTRGEIMARLPLDKRRARSEKVEGLLKATMEGYFSTLPREKLLFLLKVELLKRFDALGEAKPGALPEVMFRGLSHDEVETILTAVFDERAPSTGIIQTSWALKPADPHFTHAGQFPEIRVDTQAVRITASIDEAANALLEDSRAELVVTLLGPEALDDGEHGVDHD
ncbi:MAG: ATPase [Treponema sp.]|jgi:hypothetical protein|nr:ATPase [Treponema sp.]